MECRRDEHTRDAGVLEQAQVIEPPDSAARNNLDTRELIAKLRA
jgi:hypothetical protein